MLLRFKALPIIIRDHLILRLPAEVSAQLSSRGMGMGKCTIGGKTHTLPLEPDGRGGHWMDVTGLKHTVHQPIDVTLDPTDSWPDPVMPHDIMTAFDGDPVSKAMYANITPKARWEWLRWIRSTNSAQTRAKRIRVSIDKMHKGMRRPCCFTQSMCTVPEVSKSGVLITDEAARP